MGDLPDFSPRHGRSSGHDAWVWSRFRFRSEMKLLRKRPPQAVILLQALPLQPVLTRLHSPISPPAAASPDISSRVKEGPEKRLARMVEINEERAAKILRKWAIEDAA